MSNIFGIASSRPADEAHRSANEINMMKTLKADASFTPYPVHDSDELYANGIFEFNVTRIREYLREDPADVIVVEMPVSDLDQGFSSLNEAHVDSVDISRPVVLAEIAPGHYSLIDGHHRVEKARRLGADKLSAHKLTVLQHVRFLTNKKAYQAYIEYWNGKVKEWKHQREAEPQVELDNS